MAMDEVCDQKCSERKIHEIGTLPCQARCKLNVEKALSQSERTVILYSMVYVERENLHPDVREQLWLRASGAAQLMKSYEGYPTSEQTQSKKDYYSALEESPCPPNTSVGTIKADQSRIFFDTDVIKQSYKWEKYNLKMQDDEKIQTNLQKRFAEVMMTYHKRNGAFIYNQSQSEILIRILEVVY